MSAIKKVVSFILSCVIILSFVGCGDSSSSSLTTGQSITLSEDVPTCSSKANVDKMISFIQNNNSSGEQGMIERGEAKILSAGTKVNVIKSGIVVEIETEDGTKWYAPKEAIK